MIMIYLLHIILYFSFTLFSYCQEFQRRQKPIALIHVLSAIPDASQALLSKKLQACDYIDAYSYYCHFQTGFATQYQCTSEREALYHAAKRTYKNKGNLLIVKQVRYLKVTEFLSHQRGGFFVEALGFSCKQKDLPKAKAIIRPFAVYDSPGPRYNGYRVESHSF